MQYNGSMIDEPAIRARFRAIATLVDERARRLFAGAEALAIGHGGVAAVARATGLSRSTVTHGVVDLQDVGARLARGRVRRKGAGRPKSVVLDDTLRDDLERLIEPTTRGDPMSPLRWTCKSLRQLAAELQRQGHQVSHQTVGVGPRVRFRV